MRSEPFRFQPDWATPLVTDLSKPSWLAWFFGFREERGRCAARRQGRCPGLDQCHDCNWSAGAPS
jgi:hypothetical protein